MSGKCIKTRLVEFLDKHNFSSPNQIGFTSKSSATDVLFIIANCIYDYIDKKEKFSIFRH